MIKEATWILNVDVRKINIMPKGFYLGEPQTDTYNPQIYDDNIRGLYITSEVDASTLPNFWLRLLGINPHSV